jgi:hypothetical protein
MIRTAYRIFVGKPKGKRPRGRIMRRRKNNNIRADVKEIGCEGVNWIHLAQDTVQQMALVNMQIKFHQISSLLPGHKMDHYMYICL